MKLTPQYILYLDNHLLVVNKPPGMLTQGDETGDPDLLTLGKAYLKERFNKPGNVFLGLVHRLDRPASGVIVLGRTSKAASRLADQFRRRTPQKRYVALVEGKCIGSGVCRDYLVKEDRQVKVVKPDHPKAQLAELKWEMIAFQPNAKQSLLQIDLKTGRPHQIRVQLASMDRPIVGDLRYGAKTEHDGRNLALHCYLLELMHPVRKEKMRWAALPPDTWPDYFREHYANLIEL